MDWAEVRRRFGGSGAAGAADNLELIDRIGRQTRSSTTRLPTSPGVRPWLWLMIGAVGLQVVVAVIGYLTSSGPPAPIPLWPLLLATLVFAGAGIVVAVAGRWDPRTAPLAGLFLSIASAPAQTLLAGLPPGAPRLLVSAPLFESFLPFFLWWFVERFPRVVRVERRRGWLRWAKRTSLVIGVLFFGVNAVDQLAPGAAWVGEMVGFALRSESGAYWLTLFLLALPAVVLVFGRLRFTEGVERRRALLFVTGLAVGILPMLVAVLGEILIPAWQSTLSRPANRAVASVVVYGFLLTIPISLGYAAVARQALDLRFAAGRAVRALLARSSVVVLALGPWLILAAILWAGRERPLADLMGRPAVPVLGAAGLVGLVLLLNRERLRAGVERRFLGAPGDWNAALAAFAKRLGAVRDDHELADLVGDGAAALLQSESCFLLLRHDADQGFVSLHRGCGTVAPDSALAELVVASPEPISLDPRDRDSWLPLVPEPDRLWAMDAELRLVVPVIDSSGECLALMAFGRAASDRPYSTAQRDAATAAASTVALALARLGTESITRQSAIDRIGDRPAGECATCGRVAEASSGTCECGGALGPAAIPLVLNGKFRLEGVLGHGGMGVVYLGRDVELDRQVALKTLPRMRSGSLRRLKHEARSMASFVHPNLALIFGAETWRGVPVLVVEHLAGGTLFDRLGRPVDPRFVVELGIKIAGALAVLHAKGMLHRDVKPANIGFSDQMEPKLLDFGLAQLIEDTHPDLGAALGPAIRLDAPAPASLRLTDTAHVVGTPLYLSPEVLNGALPSPEQDLWALHVVLWEILAGRHPLDGMPRATALERVSGGRLPSIRTACPQCPEALTELVDRGLDPRRAFRRATAMRLVADLELVLAELDDGTGSVRNRGSVRS